MTALNITRPRARNNRSVRANPDIRPGIGSAERCIQKGHEFLNVTVVPTDSTLGQSLFQLEVNPSQVPRLAIIASQYKQWRGRMSLTVESLGNAFSTSSVALAYVPDPDPAELPSNPTDLLRVVESAPSRADLHLQAVATKTVTANWDLTTNPWKFVQDSDASDRANGLFLVVSYGSPGTTPVNLRVGVSYDITFQGNTYSPTAGSIIPTPRQVLAQVCQITCGPPVNVLEETEGTLTVSLDSGSFPPALQGVWPLLVDANFVAGTGSTISAVNTALVSFTVTPDAVNFLSTGPIGVTGVVAGFAFVAPDD